MEGKELFLMVEAISNEKNITQEDVIESLEEAMAVATKNATILMYVFQLIVRVANSTRSDAGK